MRFILIMWLGSVLGALGANVRTTFVQLELEQQLAQARGDAAEAREHRDQLLSGGRFVRRYDPKTGASSYTFAPSASSKPGR